MPLRKISDIMKMSGWSPGGDPTVLTERLEKPYFMLELLQLHESGNLMPHIDSPKYFPATDVADAEIFATIFHHVNVGEFVIKISLIK